MAALTNARDKHTTVSREDENQVTISIAHAHERKVCGMDDGHNGAGYV